MKEKLKRIELINKLASVWNEPMTDLRITAYMEAFSHTHIKCLEWAINKSIQVCQFFPKPADVITLAKMAPPIGPPVDLRRPILTERQYSPEEIEESKREFARLGGCLDEKFGCSVSEKIIKVIPEEDFVND